jgi:hypothetical protein
VHEGPPNSSIARTERIRAATRYHAVSEDDAMPKFWLLKGDHDAPGWDALRKDYDEGKIEIVHLDPKVWAMVEGDDPPSGYDGLTAVEPADGIYLDPQGNALYLVGGAVVRTPEEVISALGDDAVELLAKIGDPHTTLQRLGRAF